MTAGPIFAFVLPDISTEAIGEMRAKFLRTIPLLMLIPVNPGSRAVCVATDEGMDLTLNGSTMATIVKPAAATERESFSAESGSTPGIPAYVTHTLPTSISLKRA